METKYYVGKKLFYYNTYLIKAKKIGSEVIGVLADQYMGYFDKNFIQNILTLYDHSF